MHNSGSAGAITVPLVLKPTWPSSSVIYDLYESTWIYLPFIKYCQYSTVMYIHVYSNVEVIKIFQVIRTQSQIPQNAALYLFHVFAEVVQISVIVRH